MNESRSLLFDGSGQIVDPPPQKKRLTGMGMRVRMGPFSVSSRGRVGVNAGPVSFYGGGSRRSSSGGGGLLAGLIALGVLIIVVMWPLSLWGS